MLNTNTDFKNSISNSFRDIRLYSPNPKKYFFIKFYIFHMD